MGRIVRTGQAADDILEIWQYIALHQGNVPAADRLVVRFEELLRTMSEQPNVGTSQGRYRVGMRSFSTGNYVLFYEPLQDGILLLRVLHGARRFEGLF